MSQTPTMPAFSAYIPLAAKAAWPQDGITQQLLTVAQAYGCLKDIKVEPASETGLSDALVLKVGERLFKLIVTQALQPAEQMQVQRLSLHRLLQSAPDQQSLLTGSFMSHQAGLVVSCFANGGEGHVERQETAAVISVLAQLAAEIFSAEALIWADTQILFPISQWQAFAQSLSTETGLSAQSSWDERFWTHITSFQLQHEGKDWPTFYMSGLYPLIGTEVELLSNPQGIPAQVDYLQAVVPLLLRDGAPDLIKAGGVHLGGGLVLKAKLTESVLDKSRGVIQLMPELRTEASA